MLHLPAATATAAAYRRTQCGVHVALILYCFSERLETDDAKPALYLFQSFPGQVGILPIQVPECTIHTEIERTEIEGFNDGSKEGFVHVCASV